MAIVRISETDGPALDWLVAIALGWNDVQISDFQMPDEIDEPFFRPSKIVDGKVLCGSGLRWKPSTDPSQSWWLIDKEGIALTPPGGTAWWHAQKNGHLSHGPDSLVAAMRCFVITRFGESAEVPDKLLPGPLVEKPTRTQRQRGG